MIVAIGYNTAKPPQEAYEILGGHRFIHQKRDDKICGCLRFVSRDLEAFRDERNGIIGFLADPEIKWRKFEDYAIGEI